MALKLPLYSFVLIHKPSAVLNLENPILHYDLRKLALPKITNKPQIGKTKNNNLNDKCWLECCQEIRPKGGYEKLLVTALTKYKIAPVQFLYRNTITPVFEFTTIYKELIKFVKYTFKILNFYKHKIVVKVGL